MKVGKNDDLNAISRQCLTLCGYVSPLSGYGIKILSIDGGGTRGMMGLEILQELENCLGGRKVSLIIIIIFFLNFLDL